MYLTIKIENKAMYNKLIHYLKSLKIQIVSQVSEEDNAIWNHCSAEGLGKAYGKEEPDYDSSMIKEPNSEYEGR